MWKTRQRTRIKKRKWMKKNEYFSKCMITMQSHLKKYYLNDFFSANKVSIWEQRHKLSNREGFNYFINSWSVFSIGIFMNFIEISTVYKSNRLFFLSLSLFSTTSLWLLMKSTFLQEISVSIIARRAHQYTNIVHAVKMNLYLCLQMINKY